MVNVAFGVTFNSIVDHHNTSLALKITVDYVAFNSIVDHHIENGFIISL